GSRGCSVGDVWRPERRHPDSDRRRLVVCREQRRGATVHSTGGAPFVLCRFSSYVRGSRSVDEVDLHLVRDETCLIALVQEELDRAPAVRTVVEGALVHVHADELVRLCLVQPAPVLSRVRERRLPMLETVRDRVAQDPGDLADQLGPEVATDRVSAERQRKPTRTLRPPLA